MGLRSPSGLSVMEVLIGVLALGAVIYGTSFQMIQMRSSGRNYTENLGLSVLRSNIKGALYSEYALQNTLAAGDNVTALSCLGAHSCTNAQDPLQLALYDGENNLLVGLSGQSGLTRGGAPCNTYPSDECPYRLVLKWKPLCGAGCQSPLMNVSGKIFDKDRKELKDYAFEVLVRPQSIEPPSMITYDRSWVVFLRNHATRTLTPRVRGAITSFSISPRLPTGLTFDTATGIIAGQTDEIVNPGRVYTIRAHNPGGTVSTQLTLRVLEGIRVNTTADDFGTGSSSDGVCESSLPGPNNCTLRAALREASGMGEDYAVYVKNGTYALTMGRPMSFGWYGVGTLEGDALIGERQSVTQIDAQNLHGHIYANWSKFLTISDVEFINGHGETWVEPPVTQMPPASIYFASNQANPAVKISNVTFDHNNGDSTGASVVKIGNMLDVNGEVQPLKVDVEYSWFKFNNIDGGQGALNIDTRTHTDDEVRVAHSYFANNTTLPSQNTAGIFISTGGKILIDGCTFDSNQAGEGSAITFLYGQMDVKILNSTFKRNVGNQGGTILSDDNNTFTILNSTFVENRSTVWGGSLFFGIGANLKVYIGNSIVEGGFANNGPVDCEMRLGGQAISLGGNVFSQAAGSCGTGPGDRNSVDPSLFYLGPLQNNGGPMPTIALGPASLAIDAGASSICQKFDARYVPRALDGGDGNGGPKDGAARCDAGAYEAE